MGTWEFAIILALCLFLLNPGDVKIIIKNISNLIINVNKYISSVKENIIKSIDTENKK